MTDSTPRGSERIELDGGPLGMLAFDWVNDRYQHSWIFGQRSSQGQENPTGQGGIAALRSQESDTSTNWPSSPPLQQIHQQSFGDGREVTFGLGMAGRGHWSASFTLVPDLKCWIVELACKSPVAAESLSTTYELLGPWASTADAATLAIGGSQITLEPIAPAKLTIEACSAKISPITLPQSAATCQWAFRLRVSAT